MTKEEIKPIGDYIFENIPPEKRFQTNDGMYIHYSDACTLLNKHSADLTAENTRLREALKIVEHADAGILACSILESVNPKLSAQEEAFFIAGFEECMKYLKLKP